MNRPLTARSSLENLQKEAKRWLKAIRAGDTQAFERLRRAWPHAPEKPGLRDVQQALAREHGLANWAALKIELAALAAAGSGREKLLAEFLEHSCIHYGLRPSTGKWDQAYADEPSRWQYAARILERHPEIVRDSIHAAAVSGNVAEVERILSLRPQAIHEKGGPQAWEPLLYVCYGRLPTEAASENAVEIARRLLAAGANANVHLASDGAQFTALTGAIAEGEFSQPRHSRAVELAEVLIDHGADPYDPQALYNISLEGDDTFWLGFLHERSVWRNEAHRWTSGSEWPPSGALNYLLGNIVTRNALQRARWLLAHGADPNTRHAYTKRKVHTEALLLGFTAMADLVRDAGAAPEKLTGVEEFRAACMRADLSRIGELAREHPEYLRDAMSLIQVAERDLVDVARVLLDLGMSPDVRDANNYRPLHAAALTDHVGVGALLIERGAQIDPEETRFNGTPLGWAVFGKSARMIELLGRVSRSPKSLVRMGNTERLSELFAADPPLAKTTDPQGSLFAYLPDDEGLATDVAELLLAHGADPLVKNREGLNAIALLEKRGLESVADLLRGSS